MHKTKTISSPCSLSWWTRWIVSGCSTQIPMIFMGEEWAAQQPFPYFCDFDGELGEKIRQGRWEEFASFPEFQDREQLERIPDPLARETFLSAKLDWDQTGQGEHADCFDWHRRILQVRKESIVPLLSRIGKYAGSYHVIGRGAVTVCWAVENGLVLVLTANLSDDPNDGFSRLDGEVIWHEGPEPVASTMGPWSVRWSIHPKGGQ